MHACMHTYIDTYMHTYMHTCQVHELRAETADLSGHLKNHEALLKHEETIRVNMQVCVSVSINVSLRFSLTPSPSPPLAKPQAGLQLL